MFEVHGSAGGIDDDPNAKHSASKAKGIDGFIDIDSLSDALLSCLNLGEMPLLTSIEEKQS